MKAIGTEIAAGMLMITSGTATAGIETTTVITRSDLIDRT